MVYDANVEEGEPPTWPTLLKWQKKTAWLWRCCRRFKPGDEEDLEAGVAQVGKSQSKISRGNSVSFASAPSTTSANEEFSHTVPFDPEEFLRPVHQSDLVDRFYSKLAAEYEAAASASASGLAEEGLLPWRESGAAFSLSPTTRSDAMAQSRSFGLAESSYGHSRKGSSAGGEAASYGNLVDAQDTDYSHFSHFTSKLTDADGRSLKVHTEPEVLQLEHPERTLARTASDRESISDGLASRSPGSGRPSAAPTVTTVARADRRGSRSAPLISLEDLEIEQVEQAVIVTPTNQLKQKHLVFAMVHEEEQPVLKPQLKSVHFVGVDSNVAPEESPNQNRLSTGAGPLPPREEKEVETSASNVPSEAPTGSKSASGTSNVQDVHIELEIEDKKTERRSSGSSSKSAKGSPRISDEEALAALEVAQWPPPKEKHAEKVSTSAPVTMVTGRYVDEDTPVTPLPSPPIAPATPAPAMTPGASPPPSRSRAAAAAAAAAAAWTGAASGARSAMAAAGSRVSSGGAALATLVSPEPTNGKEGLEREQRERKHSVFSGRFMPLSLWAQAESATPPQSGPGSPEQKQDVKFDDDDGSSPSVTGEKTERQASPEIEVREAVPTPSDQNALPTPPIAPAERNKVAARGSSAPPDPCRAKTDDEADKGPPVSLPRPMSADSMPDKERTTGVSSATLKVPREDDRAGSLSPSSASGSRGRQGGGQAVLPSTSNRHLSPSPAVVTQDSKVLRDELHISRTNSRPPAVNAAAAETPKTKEERVEDLEDLQPAPSAGPDERISTTRMPSLKQTEVATEGLSTSSRQASPAAVEPSSEEQRPTKVRSRESDSHGSLESASPERERRHTHFVGAGPQKSQSPPTSRSGSRKSCAAGLTSTVRQDLQDLRAAYALEGLLSDSYEAHGATGAGVEAEKSGSPAEDSFAANPVDFTFAMTLDGEDPGPTRSEEETMEDAAQASGDGWCASTSTTAGPEIRSWRREDLLKPKSDAATVDSLEVNVKRFEPCKEVYELDPSGPEEAESKTPEMSQTAYGALEEDHPSEGLDGTSRHAPRKPREARRQRNRNGRGLNGSNYQDALDCLRLQAGLGMELTAAR